MLRFPALLCHPPALPYCISSCCNLRQIQSTPNKTKTPLSPLPSPAPVSHFSIRTLLIISLLLPLSIVYAVSAMIETRLNRAEAISGVKSRLEEMISKNAAEVDGHFASAAQIPTTLADMFSTTHLQNEQDFIDILMGVMKAPVREGAPELLCVCIAFEPNEFQEGIVQFAPHVYRDISGDGELLYEDLACPRQEGYDYMQRDWYRIPKKTKKAAWSEPYLGIVAWDDHPVMMMCTYSAPIMRDGRFAGVVMIDISLDEIQNTMARLEGDQEDYYLLSASGRFITAPESEMEFLQNETILSFAEKHGSDQLKKVGDHMLQGGNGTIRYDKVLNDQRRVWLAYARLPISGWNVITVKPESQVLGPVYASLNRFIFRFLLTLAVLSGLIVLVSWRLTIPIKRLAKFARKLAAGDLDAHVGDVQLVGEIDQLAHAFDKMVVDLKSNIEKRIKEETARQTVESELHAARKIQASLLPRIFPPFPERKEFDLYAMNEPVAYIAGDFFDYFFIKPDTLAFIIADVSGHGIPAALFMAVSRTAIRTFAAPEHSPHEIISKVNNVLSVDNDAMMFVTLFYGHYNVETGELTYVNGGHDPPYIVRKDGCMEKLPATGPLVATFEDIVYRERTVRLEPGDFLAAYTDGVTESHSSRDNILYGVERLERLLCEIREESVESICGRVFRDIDEFAGHESQDDVTLLVLRRNEEPSP